MTQQEASCKRQVTAVLSINGRKIINFTHSKSKKGMREGKSLNKRGEGKRGRERKREREGGDTHTERERERERERVEWERY